jgi:hypothetical protein
MMFLLKTTLHHFGIEIKKIFKDRHLSRSFFVIYKINCIFDCKIYIKNEKISLIIMALLGNFYYSQHINPVAPINISGASLTHDQLKSYIDNVNNNTLIYRENDDYSLFKGSPYLDSTYKKVKIDDFLMPQKLRYNAYSDKMEFEKDGKIYDAQIPDNAVLNFFEFNKNFKKMKYTLEGKNYDGFLTIVSEGNFLRYIKKKVLN